MLEIRQSKNHGVCNSCAKQQTKKQTIYEIRTSTTGQGWNVIMLCEDCLNELQELIQQFEDEKQLVSLTKRLEESIKANPCTQTKNDFLIYTNEDVISDENMLDYIKNYPDDCLGCTKDEIYQFLLTDNDTWMGDEINNLNTELYKQQKTNDIDIIIVADLGLWHGRKKRVKIINHTDMSELFRHGEDDMTVYGDGKNLCVKANHHDGTNHYTLRQIIPGRKENAELLYTCIANTELFQSLLEKYTQSLWPIAASCYGWKTKKTENND